MNSVPVPLASSALVTADLFSFDEAPVPVVQPQKHELLLRLKAQRFVQTASDIPLSVLAKLRSFGDEGKVSTQVDIFSGTVAIDPSGSSHFLQNARSYITTVPEATDQPMDALDLPDDLLERDETLGFASDDVLCAENQAFEVSDEFIIWIHQKMLDENLKFLTSVDVKLSAFKEKFAILQWVFAEDFINGAPAKAIFGSFVNCCIASGCDVDVVRLGLLQVDLVRELLVNFNLKGECELPRRRQTVYYKGRNPFADEFDETGAPFEPEERTIYQFAGM